MTKLPLHAALPVLVIVQAVVPGCKEPTPPSRSDQLSELVHPDAPESPIDESEAEDTAWPEQVEGAEQHEATVSVDEVADQEQDDEWIFDMAVLHSVEITLPAASYDSLLADPYTWAEGDVVFDGVPMDEVGIRLRGKIGSYRDIDEKPKFKIDFNQYVPDQRLYGIESLALSNAVVDCSYLKEPLAYAALRAAGVPASRAAMATVTVNGTDYGLYVLIEVPDDRFLARHYSDPSGNLYDGKYVWYGGYSYTLLDFSEGHDDLFQLEEGEDNGHADITALGDTLVSAIRQPDFYDRMAAVLDWDAFHREQLGEQWAGQNDGYGLNKNNYRVYFDPGTGLAHLIPWDMDYSFLEDAAWTRSWAVPTGKIAYNCMMDRTCKDAQRAVAEDVLRDIDAADLTGLFDDLLHLTKSVADSDPKRECTQPSVESYRVVVRAWTKSRSDAMRTFWEL